MQLLGQNGIEDLLKVVQYRDDLRSQINALRQKERSQGLSKNEYDSLTRL